MNSQPPLNPPEGGLSGCSLPLGGGGGGLPKEELRRFIRAQKKQYTATQLAAMSEEICNKVLASVWWQKASTLLLYYPLTDEVDVRPLIAEAFESGKQVLLPVCKGDELELHLYEGEASLGEGAFGIMEPTGMLFPEADYPTIRLAIIPGMAFDRVGHRLGRGKGYYDRLLPKLTKARLQGICFPFQLLDEVPTNTHDIAVHDVMSDSENP